MIRLINLAGQGTGYNFAFWDTITDSFLQFNNVQAWENLDHFEFDFHYEEINNENNRFKDIDRFKSLFVDFNKSISLNHVIELNCYFCGNLGITKCGRTQKGCQPYKCRKCRKTLYLSCRAKKHQALAYNESDLICI